MDLKLWKRIVWSTENKIPELCVLLLWSLFSCVDDSQEFTDFMQGRRMLWILTPLLIITQVFIIDKCQWTDLLAKCWLENTRRDFESRESFISGVATGYYPVPFLFHSRTHLIYVVKNLLHFFLFLYLKSYTRIGELGWNTYMWAVKLICREP